jgi:hypothetical protein
VSDHPRSFGEALANLVTPVFAILDFVEREVLPLAPFIGTSGGLFDALAKLNSAVDVAFTVDSEYAHAELRDATQRVRSASERVQSPHGVFGDGVRHVRELVDILQAQVVPLAERVW